MPCQPILSAPCPTEHKLGHIKLPGNEKRRIEPALPDVKDRVLLLRDSLRNLGQPVAEKPSKARAQSHTSAIHL